MIVFTVPMAHFRGIPTYLRERFGVPVVFYDGDVPMSLPEFGGMDTGFNYYHGADPSEYDLVVSNSEGGLASLLELGARRAEAVFWGADPEFFAPAPGREGARRLLLRLRGQVPPRLDGGDGRRAEPRRARARLRARRPRLPGRHRPRLARRRRSVQRLRPARSLPSRINLNITRRSHASVSASSSCRPFELAAAGAAIVSNPYEGIERWFEPGQELLVVNDADEALAAYRELLDDPAPGRGDGRAARASASSTSTRTPIARGSCSRWSASVPRRPRVPERRRLAIVPARNEEAAVGRVVEELRAFDPELDVLVIDDGSEDATAASARRRGRRRRPAAVQPRHRRRRSDGLQVRARARLRHSSIRLDGDGQHDPQEIPQLLAPLARGEADVVVGSRFADGNGDYRPPFARRAGIRWFAQLVSLLTRQKLTDTTSGFQAVNARRSGSSPPTIRTTTPRWRRP